jgi:hypothetical protein
MRLFLGCTAAIAMLAATTAPTRAQDIGIAACDTFLKTYTGCIAGNVPAAQQQQMNTMLEQLKTNWRAVAATPEGKTQLEAVCKQTADAIKQQTAAMGCKW